MLPGCHTEGSGAGRTSYRGQAGDGCCLLGLLLRYGGGVPCFVTDIAKTDAENKERLHDLIDDVEALGERLAKLFEPEVLPLETGTGAED